MIDCLSVFEHEFKPADELNPTELPVWQIHDASTVTLFVHLR